MPAAELIDGINEKRYDGWTHSNVRIFQKKRMVVVNFEIKRSFLTLRCPKIKFKK